MWQRVRPGVMAPSWHGDACGSLPGHGLSLRVGEGPRVQGKKREGAQACSAWLKSLLAVDEAGTQNEVVFVVLMHYLRCILDSRVALSL